MTFKVINAVDGDTVQVSPNWKWNNLEGDIVRINGYDAPEQGNPEYQAAKDKLHSILVNKDVELKNPIRITYGRLLCDVFIEGKNVAELFPEYK